ncbi:hypothetical protein CXB51_035746 [Gossypium anomalum]|uniref:RNase H type-1 domain-containing protein n=1 Tax=Gossypium anomalum TaxID=47600 RepID=A0A8J6CFY1_9ROSI|nr:hypothetical protein CXB51_035746 [Gossypium anomalum]
MHEGRRQTVNDLCTFVLGYVKELVLLEKTYPTSAQGPPVKWCPPEPRWFKVNFDVRFHRDLQSSSARSVIKDEAGLVMGASCTWNRNVLSAEVAEALAAVQAIPFAQEMGFHRVLLQVGGGGPSDDYGPSGGGGDRA